MFGVWFCQVFMVLGAWGFFGGRLGVVWFCLVGLGFLYVCWFGRLLCCWGFEVLGFFGVFFGGLFCVLVIFGGVVFLFF